MTGTLNNNLYFRYDNRSLLIPSDNFKPKRILLKILKHNKDTPIQDLVDQLLENKH